jgi:ferritin-like metal-binding protein YciE
MSNEKALVPVEQKTVEFYEDEVTAVRLASGEVFVPIRPIVEGLGLDWAAQTRRINRDPILAEETKPCVVVTATQGQPDQRREMLCLPLKFISGFLFGVNANRVKKEIRDRLLRYQRECYDVLAEAFVEGRLTADPTFSELLKSESPAAQAYKMARAMMELARNQLLLESRLETHDLRLEDHDRRLEEVEAALGDSDRHVTPDQASQISQAVKTVAMKLSKQSGRNEYGGVYGELYRKFGITSYKQLPAAKFDEAMSWLNEWRESVEGDVPF